MKADRLLSVLLLLQAHGKLSARQLADRLEVSLRTVHRDMEALSAAGVPVFAARGAHGGWQVDEDWRTRVPGLDETELRALLMAQPRALGHPRLAAIAERALTKLLAAMPPLLRERAAVIQQRLHVDVTGWRGTVEDISTLPQVQDAVWGEHKLRIRYRGRDHHSTDRTIEPLGLVAKGTIWYLVANSPDGLRTYRVSRIEEVTMLDTRFERPRNFDLADFWRSSTEELRHKRQYLTTLRVDPVTAEGMKMWWRVLPLDDGAQTDQRGRITLRVQFEDESAACYAILSFGSRVEVDEPASLRARIAAEISAMSERYALNKLST
jgi:predicted DNA-binding transcriptional regulator YafY